MCQILGVTCSERFRFQSFAHLDRLVVGFNFSAIIYYKGYKLHREEMILISLTRLEFPNKWSQMYDIFRGRKTSFFRANFYYFLDFMIVNWAYLLLNNMPYWKPHLASSNEAIRQKLMVLNHAAWRVHHPPAGQPGGYDYAVFLDDTINAFCRPGGVMAEGPAAPRVPLEVQQAWWTGWKKLHGIKWQTVTLANGMDFFVFGPLSVRRNDLQVLKKSKFEASFRALQQGDPFLFKCFGDSAFDNEAPDIFGSGGGRGNASVRETIEWTYKVILFFFLVVCCCMLDLQLYIV